jgi:hypothetical protein
MGRIGRRGVQSAIPGLKLSMSALMARGLIALDCSAAGCLGLPR